MWSISEPIYRQAIPSPAKAWRQRFERYALRGNAVQNTESVYFPPRRTPHTGEGVLEERQLSGLGAIVSLAEDHTPLVAQGGRAVRPVGIVQLNEGPAVMAEIVGASYEELKPGMPVEMVIRKWRREATGLYQYGYKFRLR